jgi:DNA-binding response OmpR family regulator
MESILVIEDNLDLLSMQRIILEMEGYEVFTAQSGDEAFNFFLKLRSLI